MTYLKNIFLVLISIFILQTTAHAKADEVCRAWFGTLGISKGDKRCGIKCTIGDVGMATYSCPNQCDDLCTESNDCPAGTKAVFGQRTTATCLPIYETKKDKGKSCDGLGNPCSVSTGNKFQVETDWKAPVGPLEVTRVYNSLFSDNVLSDNTPFGSTRAWTHNYAMRLYFTLSGTNITSITLWREDGKEIIATPRQGRTTPLLGTTDWYVDPDTSLILNQLSSGWEIKNLKNSQVETYDSKGRLIRIAYIGNQFVTISYSNTTTFKANTITDQFGRKLTLTYDRAGYLTSIKLPNAQSVQYSYSGNILWAVNRPSSGTKYYNYNENTLVAPSKNPYLLTGISNELGNRFANYAYDEFDRGILTEHAGNTQQFRFNYSENNTQVTDPYGTQREYSRSRISGTQYIGTVKRGTTTESRSEYDSSGNLVRYEQFGQVTTYEYDLSRNLETKRIEAAGTTEERITTTQWHATLALPIEIQESLRKINLTYDNAGNLLTRTITDLTTKKKRTWTYTYNNLGQILTLTEPTSEKTIYSYDNTGNLLTVTDSAGLVTSYSNYNTLGQPQIITFPSGHKITYTYDNLGRVLKTVETRLNPNFETSYNSTSKVVQWAQWITDLINQWSQSVGLGTPFSETGTSSQTSSTISLSSSQSATTTYVYDHAGQLTQVIFPDGEILNYEYDRAQRLALIRDNTGNTVNYTRNNAGAITHTAITDNYSNILFKTETVYDTLGRVSRQQGDHQQNEQFSYDDFNQLTEQKNALNQTSGYQYDALGRPKRQRNPAQGSIQYQYDSLDQLKTITDARGNTTTYHYNAFGDLESVNSPDTRLTTYQYDDTGRLTQYTDSQNNVHAYTYDNAQRVRQKTDGSGSNQLTTSFDYDGGQYGQGELTQTSNANSRIRYIRDSAGNVIEKAIALKPNLPLRVQYNYTAGGKLANILYPSGLQITYTYNQGLLNNISSSTGGKLLQNVRYTPMGISGWDWGTGYDQFHLLIDTDGRINDVTSTGILTRHYNFDVADRITNISDSNSTLNSGFNYDVMDRLIQQNIQFGDKNSVLSYSYDANGNRTQQNKAEDGISTDTAFSIANTSNRINSYSYLATGQVTQDNIRSYQYDAAGRSSRIQKNSSSIENRYDPLGQRVIKYISNTGVQSVVYFVYNESGQLLGEYDQNRNRIREYIWLGDRLVGMLSQERPNVLLRVHTDHLMTPRAVSEGDGDSRKVLWRWDGDQFGDVLPNEDVDANNIKFTMPLRHAGQYYDSEVGTFYNYFRDYNPATGRYVQSDPLGLFDGPNTYAYAYSNPVSYNDPTGQFVPILAGVAIGAGTDLGIQLVLNGGNFQCVSWAQVGVSGALGAIGGGWWSGSFKHAKSSASWFKLSTKWKNVSPRARKAQDTPKGYELHHWLIERNSWVGKKVPDVIKNHPWNLKAVERSVHQRIHGNSKRLSQYDPIRQWWYATPTWAKGAEISIGSGIGADMVTGEQ
ncbi:MULTISPECIES: RHS repeat-associated core domain-containing protein [Acinetobacter]|uniref:RHS repeat-associated core domain-containing protein n=1 Tax=Acinetobacter TaxID=469 RepID=UPI00141BA2AD|nr:MULTISPECIES: RHS repeat-associated core domain-containing protein [Acinetobacter]MCS4298242.1 RHS repeat-associated protein [Acinetobacter guillouiae]MCW2251846.1 RHS repeat-associated protein [Acinetobacter sp. BIGb0204]NII38500.1 RHS repeat-associated protein [Acinetobacter sp. BIGb0196]